jgi:hypothetical protein
VNTDQTSEVRELENIRQQALLEIGGLCADNSPEFVLQQVENAKAVLNGWKLPVREMKAIPVDAFNQSIELLELIARTSDDELTVNRLGHAIRMLRGEEAPVPF